MAISQWSNVAIDTLACFDDERQAQGLFMQSSHGGVYTCEPAAAAAAGGGGGGYPSLLFAVESRRQSDSRTGETIASEPRSYHGPLTQ